MRRSLALSAVAVVAAAPLAWAAPAASPQDGAAVDFQLVAGGHTQQLELLVTRPSQGAPQLRVRLIPESGAPRRLFGELVPSALTSTGDPMVQGTMTLRARIGGAPLTVVWHTAPGALTVSMGSHDSDGNQAEGWGIAGAGGPVDVTLAGSRCAIDAGAVGPAFTYDTDGYGAPLARGLGVPLRGARCRPLPSSLPPIP